ncbi:MAG TPA: hypothetical protein VNV66_20665 [Pilimelia sp.]|nr:hypothetical protein [Pilimelia sp.]
MTAWKADRERLREAHLAGMLLVSSARDSLRLIAGLEERMVLDDLDAASPRLAVEYLDRAPQPITQTAVAR